MSEIYYTKEHEWVKLQDQDNVAIIGISDYAQKQLGDLVFIELPQIGDICARGDAIIVVESVKAASDVYAPLSGEIIEINEMVDKNPATVNLAAEEVWLCKIKLNNKDEIKDLLNSEDYKKIT